MLKLLLLALVVGVVLWMMRGRRRPPGQPQPPPPQPSKPGHKRPPAQMLACAHCDVHIPQAEAVFNAAGQGFCSDAHRLAGPR